MSIIRLTEPDVRYMASYVSALEEYRFEGLELDYDYPEPGQSFKAFTKALREPVLKPQQVPYTIFWLVDGDDYIGRLALRHELNDNLLALGGHIGFVIRPSKRRKGYGREILRQGLLKARELGLKRVLVTCNVENTGSRRIIEANGGVLENQYDRKLRFWIPVPKPKGAPDNEPEEPLPPLPAFMRPPKPKPAPVVVEDDDEDEDYDDEDDE